MKEASIFSIVVSFMVISGCMPDTSGDPPPSDRLIYPVGLATTASDDYLLVANSNFDLRYNAGTLVAIDLKKLEYIQQGGGKETDTDTDADAGTNTDAGTYTGINLDEWRSPSGEFLYVPPGELIDPKDTIRMDAFASDLELTPNMNRALIPVRGGKERHILVVEVDETAANGRVLSCGQGDGLKCDSAHRVTSNEDVTLPIEPYAVSSMNLSRRIIDDDNREVTVTNTLGFATHLKSGSVSAFIIDNNQGGLDARLIDVVNNVVKEASGIGVNPINNEIYVSGRENDEQYLAVLKILTGGLGGTYTNKPYFGVTDKVSYASDLLGGTDTRGIAVTSDGSDAFVISRTPEALLHVDTETRKLIDKTTVGADPSVAALYEDETGSYVFVVCYKSNQVFIVETDTMNVHVRTTGLGPQAVAFDKKRKLAYIANFTESTISVIHATPPFDHVRIAGEKTKLMIGKPHLPEDHN